METLHVRVEGRVQGVGFRWFVRERARRLGLAGWVRNCEDGSVEVAARGDAECIGMLRDFLARGPEGARVSQLLDLPVDGATSFDSPFVIIR